MNRWLLAPILYCLFVSAHADNIDLQSPGFAHIHFTRIQPNTFSHENDALKIEVNQSASFLFLPFEQIKTIRHVSFVWKKQGEPNISSPQEEETRQGDDASLRVGLLLSGETDLLNPLAPKWMKQVRQSLFHASSEMVYLVAGSKHEHGAHWKSPYSKHVDMIAVDSRQTDGDWLRSDYEFEKPVHVVGLWLMADGDNTRSTFTSTLKTLELK